MNINEILSLFISSKKTINFKFTELIGVTGINITANGLGSSLQEILECQRVVSGDQRCQFFKRFFDGTFLGFDLVMASSFYSVNACSFNMRLKMGCLLRGLNLRDLFKRLVGETQMAVVCLKLVGRFFQKSCEF